MTKDNTIDEMGRINPKDPQAELPKDGHYTLTNPPQVFNIITIDPLEEIFRKIDTDVTSPKYFNYDDAIKEILALFQAHQQELLSELLGELPLQYDNYTGTSMEDYQNGHNAAIDQVVEVLNRKIGELNG